MPDEKYLSVDRAAQFLGMTAAALDKRRQRNQPPAFYKFGKTVKYKMQDLVLFEQEARRDPGANEDS